MKYVKQLDSIRAIAVLLVIVFHWSPKPVLAGAQYNYGHVGVEIFFVLSGFLITRILLENRNEAEGLYQKKKILKSFYVRRFLRIFPIYYLTILASFLLHQKLKLSFTNGEILSSLTYTSNFYIYSTKYWPQLTSHLWSVAVEEQFYLFWPLLMLFLPKRSLLACILFFICVGLVGQATMSDREFGSIQLHTSFDCLGMGALLAWMVVYKAEYLSRFCTFIRLLGLVSLAVLGCKIAGVLPAGQTSVFIGALTMWAILNILISGARGSWLTFVLNNKLLINIGKVSYGLYLYHVLFGFFMGRIWDNISHTFSLSITTYAYYLICLINFIILFFFCWLSFRFIETPILSLKKKFNYKGKASTEKEKGVSVTEMRQVKMQ